MNKRQLAPYFIIGLLCAALGIWYANQGQAPTPTPRATVSSAADALYQHSLDDLDGVPQSLAKWKGKPLLVNFWATWCAPCVQEMPELSALAAGELGQGVHIIGIGIDSPSNMREFSAKLNITYPLYVAGMGGTELSRSFGNITGGLPYTVLIGADGTVLKTYVGKLKFDELHADLAKLQG